MVHICFVCFWVSAGLGVGDKILLVFLQKDTTLIDSVFILLMIIALLFVAQIP